LSFWLVSHFVDDSDHIFKRPETISHASFHR
jgi:hypothetical protein